MRGCVIALAVLLTIAGVPARAAPTFSVQLGADLRWFDWREHLDGRQLLSEIGPQLLGQLQLAWQQGPWQLRIDSGVGGGLAYYDGQLQNGTPYTSTAYEAVLDTEYALRWRDARGEIGIGLLQRDWLRYIEGDVGVSPAEERYRWRLWLVGGEWRVHLGQAFELRLAAQVGEPFSRSEKVYFRNGDDTLALEPGPGTYWRIGLPLLPRGGSTLRIEPYYQQQSMARSAEALITRNGLPTGFVAFQPASIRRELGVALRWQMRRRAP
ncbi:MAG: hypothetical protein ACK4UT_02005 [Moraxellaceae bacterium]